VVLFIVPFRESRLKIQRANEHIADIKRHVGRIADAYVLRINVDANTGKKSIQYGIDNSPVHEKLALIIGDAAHNLKCALDFAWLETIKTHVPGAVNSFTRFPVRDSRDELETTLTGREIHTSSLALFDVTINKIKPYSGGNDSIWAVHRLDILDKHRLLIPTLSIAVANFELEDDAGKFFVKPLWVATGNRLSTVPIELNLHIKNKGQPHIAILLDMGVSAENVDIVLALPEYSQAVLGVVETLETL
jgi:hypothetical protein